ncbi:ThuA domain-containing protein [Salipiger sp. P9]|uniref:ThuA domain-containing protein n=1 Tax=Salipiger pentaromativorans TaxID=2943193 RepID=UPI002157601C|nr:ThuA domain-containing protein [Salipiger pentaromativorans]MCR8548397.1 ThuA domain-containing protein [Salipiger pentaromativorans]
MKSCLIVSGGYEPHRPHDAAAIVAGELEQQGFSVTLSDTLSAYDDLDLGSYDLIVPNWTIGEMSVPTAKRLWAAVEAGTGLGGFHGGMADAFRNSDRFRFIVGGSYAAEPGGVTDYRVNITRPDDPVMQGLSDFDYRSEQYFLHVDPSVEVLATTTYDGSVYDWLDGAVMPVVWKKRFGKGRVFFSALGHVPEEFDVPEMRTLLIRGLVWAAR